MREDGVQIGRLLNDYDYMKLLQCRAEGSARLYNNLTGRREAPGFRASGFRLRASGRKSQKQTANSQQPEKSEVPEREEKASGIRLRASGPENINVKSLRATDPDFIRGYRWNEQFLKILPGPPFTPGAHPARVRNHVWFAPYRAAPRSGARRPRRGFRSSPFGKGCIDRGHR